MPCNFEALELWLVGVANMDVGSEEREVGNHPLNFRGEIIYFPPRLDIDLIGY